MQCRTVSLRQSASHPNADQRELDLTCLHSFSAGNNGGLRQNVGLTNALLLVNSEHCNCLGPVQMLMPCSGRCG